MLTEPLLAWYDTHKRNLPWRENRDPYSVWVSEVMLQQTQVATVLPYWMRWMQRFPTIEALAEASEQEVLSLWQGLGYYRRCRMLHAGARFVRLNGMPVSAADWQRVPGVGPYTAGAIASIAFNQAAALVDGNVERVYARLNADDACGASLTRNAWSWARANLHATRPGDWNQALMELGATVCTPKNPNCGECPVAMHCRALANDLVQSLPKQTLKPKPVALKHVVWVPVFETRFGVRQIPPGAWWAGMWEFPRADSDRAHADLPALIGPGRVTPIGTVRHSVTNHRITIEVHLARCEVESSNLRWCELQELADLPIPAPQRKVLAMVMAELDRG